MSFSIQHIILPHPDEGWLVWKSPFKTAAQPLSHLKESESKLPQPLVGLPSSHVRSIGLILPQATPELVPSMLQAQLERKGILTDASAHTAAFSSYALGSSGNFQLFSVDVSQPNLPEDWLLDSSESYVAAHRAYELPDHEMVLIEELRQWVLWVTVGHQVWHNMVLGNDDQLETQDLVRELLLAKLAVESQEGFGVLRGITLVGHKAQQFEAAIQKKFALPVHGVERLKLAPSASLQGLPRYLPASILAKQKRQKRNKQFAFLGAIMALVYVVLFTAAYLYLQNLEKKVTVLEDELLETAAPAALVKDSTARWRALESAIDFQRYPIIQLGQINTILPPSGIQIKKFSATPTTLSIDGDSRDAQTATQFLDDLKKHNKLSRYEWNMPVPSVRNNIATFKIQGKLHGS